MGFQVSPGVNVSEISTATVVPAVSSTEGAIAGVFNWGPVEQRVLVDSELTLVSRFGKPTTDNAETFFTAANFLAYGNKLYVVRTVSSAGLNAINSAYGVGIAINNEDDYENGNYTVANSAGVTAARYVGALGNSLRVEVCDTDEAFANTLVIAQGSNTTYGATSVLLDGTASLTNIAVTTGSNTGVITMTGADNSTTNTNLTDEADAVVAKIQLGDVIKVGNSTIGEQYLEVTAIAANTADVYSDTGGGVFDVTRNVSFKQRYTLSTDYSTISPERKWKYWDQVDTAPGTSTFVDERGGSSDELHVIVIDEDGVITGTPGAVIEKYEATSRATDAKTESGVSNYYRDVIGQTSSWVYFVNDPAVSYTGIASTISTLSTTLPYQYSLANGADGNNETAISLGDLAVGYDMFADAADVDVSLILTGRANGGSVGEGLFNYIIDNICEVRKDCMVFGSPEQADVVNNLDPTTDVVAFRNACRSTSYAVLDSGYKYQYDKYNDVYRWIPLNGDIAGLVVRTDDVRDPWVSPGGYNRGQIKNVVKLAWNPKKAYRDVLYKNAVNPVISEPGQGTLLLGDKTLLGKPTAFDRINVRRLFIVLEKAIANAAKGTLMEFNDEFTRARFVSTVEPFLRDVQGRRGITDFQVVCDDSNNTGEVIDSNRFAGDIYIKPNRSINFIQLNFVSVRSNVEFSEIVGKF